MLAQYAKLKMLDSKFQWKLKNDRNQIFNDNLKRHCKLTITKRYSFV